MSFWSNLAGYQLVWFAAVIGAGRGVAWPGLVAAAAFAASQLALAPRRRAALQAMAAAVVVGLVFDGALAASGLATYAAPWPGLPAPAWILAIWASFALTLDVSLAVLQRHLWLAALLGGVGGPLAYLAAARGWQAVVFADGPTAIVALAIGWALALPALLGFARRGRVSPAPPPLAGVSP